ncbi:hypothetical protein Halar_0501 (plasmid) [halophilic archaeon DL31]|jgi:hypothetical protein|nr:hypothetical protein Halar_0501 [halophilic archaeon DL31]
MLLPEFPDSSSGLTLEEAFRWGIDDRSQDNRSYGIQRIVAPTEWVTAGAESIHRFTVSRVQHRIPTVVAIFTALPRQALRRRHGTADRGHSLSAHMGCGDRVNEKIDIVEE